MSITLVTKRYVTLAFCLVAIVAAYFLISATAQALNTHSVELEESLGQYFSVLDGVPNGLDLTGDFTVEAWVKAESLSDGDIVAKVDDGNAFAYMFNVRDTGQLFVAYSNDVGHTQVITDNTVIVPGVWQHVAVSCTVGSIACSFYVDGTLVPSSNLFSGANSVQDVPVPFLVGANLNGGSPEKEFDGLLDEVRVWSVARTGIEIASNRSVELTGSESGLAGYWQFNNSLADTTANGNTLTSVEGFLFSTDKPFDNQPPFSELLKVRKSVNESVSGSVTLQDDDALKLSLKANTTYIIDGVIIASATNGTPDIAIKFNGQPGTNLVLAYTNDSSESVLDAGETSPRVQLQGDVQTSMHVHGTVVTGSTNGDLVLQWAQATSNVNNPTTVLQGSYLRAEEL